MALDTTKYELGACSITVDGATLGYISENTVVTVKGGMKTVMGGHAPSPEQAFSSGEEIGVKGEFMQAADLPTILNKVIPSSTLSGSVLKVGRAIGYRASQNSVAIVIHPLDQSGVTKDWTIYKALFTGDTSMAFTKANERVIPFEIIGLYDVTRTDGDRLFGIGVSADTTPPTATISPLHEATGVAVTANVVITFNEAMSLQSLIDDTGQCRCATLVNQTDESYVACAATVTTTTNANDTLTLNPDASLGGTKLHRVVLSETAKDLAGNSFAGAQYEFTTV